MRACLRALALAVALAAPRAASAGHNHPQVPPDGDRGGPSIHDHTGGGGEKERRGELRLDFGSQGMNWLMGKGGGSRLAGLPPEKQWQFIHRRLEQRIAELSNDENRHVREVATKIHQEIDAYANQNLGEGWEERPEGEAPPKPIPTEVFEKLCRAAAGVRTVMIGADRIAELKSRADREGPRMSKEEFQRLVSEARTAKEHMDGVMMNDAILPKEIHQPLMEDLNHPNSITRPLKEIGYDMNGHINWMQQSMPSPGVHTGAAQYHAGNRDWAAAERAADQALQMQPDNAAALTVRAQSRFETGNYSGALQDSRAALTLEPGNEAARGIAMFSAGRLGEPMVAPKTGNPFQGPDDAGRIAGGITGPAAMMSDAEKESNRFYSEGMSKIGMKDFESARKAFDRALEANPMNAAAHLNRAWLVLNAKTGGSLSDAVADLRTVLRVSPKQGPAAIAKLGRELLKGGKYGEAKAVLELLRPDQRDAAVWYDLAAASYGLGDRRGMLAALEQAARLDQARYGEKFLRAKEASLDENLDFLFDQIPVQRESAPRGRAKGSGAGNRLLWTILAMLAGGLLVALGVATSRSEGFTTRMRRAVGAEPPVELAEPAPPPAPADENLVGNFELVRQIGLGGMGIVYEGLDRTLGRRVAIKKMREEIRVDPRERERFVTEARTVARLQHPNIVAIHSIIERGDDVFLVFEFVDGATLYETLDRRGRLPVAEAARLVEQVGEALTYAHSRDIIHRDLKPSNVMIADGGSAKVMDFGVARQAKDAVSKLSMTNTIVGTPPYMAPEQEQGVVCKESDVYALAVCFYELVTGRLPFQGTGAGMLLNKMNKTYAPATTLAPELPAGLDAFFAKALEPEPSRRFRTVGELLTALRSVTAAR
ncbi:MAG: protein kinase [Elusimicrobia bacterium]|nr:protein kinase [Elusimicrobiota bacterium]